MRGNYVIIDEAISGYLMRLPRSLRLLAMTIIQNLSKKFTRKIYVSSLEWTSYGGIN
ncbi:hypothetical protein RAMDARK_0295 [Rickettsia amblyommatis str. Darkwater]|nr:hypothetical protein RAMDARK_0295 [Rickettsia amblyommatis str. Darkwater]